MKLRYTLALSAGVAAVVTAAPGAPAFAQETIADEIVVTGSRLRRADQADRSSPLATVGAEQIEDIGAVNIADITQTLTINTGAENNPDAFTQGQTTGTENINLRGLGVSSTLVLLDSQRQATSAPANNDGVNFVDTASLVPLIAVERVEILKDGASAIYGSDAVAGVVNFITRENFDGGLVSGTYLLHPSDGNYNETNLQGMYGFDFDRGNILAAVSYLNRSALGTDERRLSRQEFDLSNVGLPGSYFGVPGFPASAPVIDPYGCQEFGGVPNVISATPPGVPDVGICRFDFGDFYSLVPEEERVLGMLKAQFDVTDSIEWTVQLTGADNETIRRNSPTYPFLQNRFVSADNPDNPFGVPVVGLVRALGNGSPAALNSFETETYRIATTLTGDAFKNGYWEIGALNSQQSLLFRNPDVVTDRFQCALIGFDTVDDANFGYDCGPATALAAEAGVADEFFNPFATLFTTNPNSPELIDFLIEDFVTDITSELTVVDAVVSTELFDMAGGPAAIAVGAQYRLEERQAEYDDIANADNFGFLIGAQDYDADQDVYAIFGEVSLPITEAIELTGALRYEDYGDLGNTLDPKVGVLVRPMDTLSLRGSYSTSFRVPSVFQRFGQATALQQVTDPIQGGSTFVGVRTTGAENLAPEDSRAFNIGATWEPIEDLVFDVDYFDFQFEDVITAENYQGLVNDDPTSDQIVRNDAGSIVLIFVNRFNANAVETAGIDLSARYRFDVGQGTLMPTFTGTYVTKYELDDPFQGSVDGAGQRNFSNFGSPTPELRFNAGLEWNAGIHTANAYVRYIDSYVDDQDFDLDGVLQDVDSDVRLDVRYSVDLADAFGRSQATQFTLGVRNLTDERPPQVATNGGYDSKVSDPRGRLVYVGLDIGF